MAVSPSIDLLLERAQRALSKGNLARAQKALTEAAQLFLNAPQKPDEQRRALFSQLYALARALQQAGQESQWRLVCFHARSCLPSPSVKDGEAIAFVLLGSAQHQAETGNYAEAEAQLTQALAQAEEWCSQEAADTVRCWFARFLVRRRHFRRAHGLLQVVLRNKKDLPWLVVVEAQQLCALCLTELREFDEAVREYTEALRLLTRDKTNPQRIRIVCDMARAQRLGDRMPAAQQHLREAIAMLEESDATGRARVLREEAAIAYCQNRWDAAVQLYEEALELMRAHGDDHGLEYADALVALSMTYFSMHRSAPMEELLITALRTMRRELGPRSPESAPVLHKLAGLYKQQGRFVEASVMLIGVEEITGKAHLIDPLVESAQNFQAALNLHADGHLLKALKRYKHALRAFSHLDEGKSYDTIAIHIRMFEIYLTLGEEALAEQSYAAAAQLIDNTFGFQKPDLFACAMTLAAAFQLQDKDDLAESFYLLSLACARRDGDRAKELNACNEYAAMLECIGRHRDGKLWRKRARTLLTESLKKPRKAAVAAASTGV